MPLGLCPPHPQLPPWDAVMWERVATRSRSHFLTPRREVANTMGMNDQAPEQKEPWSFTDTTGSPKQTWIAYFQTICYMKKQAWLKALKIRCSVTCSWTHPNWYNLNVFGAAMKGCSAKDVDVSGTQLSDPLSSCKALLNYWWHLDSFNPKPTFR